MTGCNKAEIRILTNHPGQEQSQAWRSATTYVPVYGNGFMQAFRVGLRMFCQRSVYNCVVLGAGRSNMAFAILQALLPVPRKPCLMIDCLWYRSPGRIESFIKTAMMKFVDRSVDRYVVWARREIVAYSREFRLPQEKFIFIPYHTTLDTTDIKVYDEGYIFSGGNFARDYKTLIEAVCGVSAPLLIASTRPELFKDFEIPENVTVQGFSHEEYLKRMAGCSMNIVALAPGLLHSGGQQTFLNSMYLGKPTIVTDPEGACDYIEDGKDGILVKPGNPMALRQAINWVLEHPEQARAMGERARCKALNLTTEDHFQRIIALAEEIIHDKAQL